MKYGDGHPYRRVEAKYMRYGDFLNRDRTPGMSVDGSNNFVWVVAASGHYGISPLGRATWGIAVVKDEWGAENIIFESGVSGDWPPFFDDVPDLARD